MKEGTMHTYNDRHIFPLRLIELIILKSHQFTRGKKKFQLECTVGDKQKLLSSLIHPIYYQFHSMPVCTLGNEKPQSCTDPDSTR